jgi:hypothetical protein
LGWKCLVILWQFEIYLDIFISICYFLWPFWIVIPRKSGNPAFGDSSQNAKSAHPPSQWSFLLRS